MVNDTSLDFPNLQANHAVLTSKTGFTNKDGIVQPCILAVLRSLEYGCCTEIELIVAIFVLSRVNQAFVADMDVHAIIRLDTVNCLQFRTTMSIVLQLIVSTAWNDGTFHLGALECASHNRNDKTIAVILETVQGEGGIYPADQKFLEGIRTLCDERGMLLILDEIQCGLCRTGSLYAYMQYGIIPDVMTTAKALGQGVPVGAFMARGKAADVLVPGDHGSTYGGNPFAAAAVCKTIDMIESEKLTDHVNEITPVLEKALDELVEAYDFVKARRGKGLMQGIVVTVPPAEVIKKTLDEGLILFSAGADVIRFVPPLIINESHVAEMKDKLCKVFNAF